jgi:VWFA-related protein
MHRRLLVTAACLVLATGAVRVQTQDRPTFRGGVDLVRVDLYASQDGKPVTDLRPEEIEIREDGDLQRIESFERVEIAPGGPEETRIQPNSIRDSEQAATDPRARVFVLFLDSYHLEAQFSTQLMVPFRRFLEEALGPDDLVAVMTPEMDVTDLTFTRRSTVLAGLLGNTMEWMIRDVRDLPLDEREEMYYRCYAQNAQPLINRRREKLTLDALESLTTHLGIIRDERKTVLVATMGWELYGPNHDLADREMRGGNMPIPVAPVDPVVRGTDGRSAGGTPERTWAQCEADRRALALLDHTEKIRDITGEANRGNVSFYPITPLRDSPLARLSALRELAQNSDGVPIVNTNNIAEPMQRLIADTSFYYLVGYQSSKPPDGSFRTIRVSVTRPGVVVRARRGYRSLPTGITTPASPAPSVPRPDAAVARALNSAASAHVPVPLRLRASAWAAPGGTNRLWVVAELDAATRREPAWRSPMRAEVIASAPDGSVLRQTIEVPQGQHVVAVQPGDGRALPPGDYDVRVTLRAGGTSTETAADSVRVELPGSPSPLGDPIVLRAGPSGQARHVDTADLRFRRNERLRVEVPTTSGTSPDVAIVDRAGTRTQIPVNVSRRPDASGAFEWLVVDLALNPFAMSEYALVFTEGGDTRAVGFRIVQ